MLHKLSQVAAIAVRDGVDAAIRNLEERIKIKLDGVNEQAKDYFVAQQKHNRAALIQLHALRAELHKRAFDAYIEEQ